MPLPLNQKTKRDSTGFPASLPAAAYAVPLELNIASSAGTPTRTAAPASPTPRRNVRLEIGGLMISLGTLETSPTWLLRL